MDQLGIDVVVQPRPSTAWCRVFEEWCLRELWHVGQSPTIWAVAAVDSEGKGYVLLPGEVSESGWAAALHEALHLVLGRDTLADELEMMPVEWSVAQLLAPRFYRAWRRWFEDFGIDYTLGEDTEFEEIGSSDRFLESSTWEWARECARKKGWLNEQGQCALRGAHPSHKTALEQRLQNGGAWTG